MSKGEVLSLKTAKMPLIKIVQFDSIPSLSFLSTESASQPGSFAVCLAHSFKQWETRHHLPYFDIPEGSSL